MNKKALSTIVATVLLILVTVTAVVFVASVIIPMVKNNLGEETSCFELRDYVKIEDLGYNCYNEKPIKNTTISIKRGMENKSISGIVVSISSGAELKRFDVPGSNEVKLLSREPAVIPNPGEAKTYVFDNIAGNKAILGVKLNSGKICEIEEYEIVSC